MVGWGLSQQHRETGLELKNLSRYLLLSNAGSATLTGDGEVACRLFYVSMMSQRN